MFVDDRLGRVVLVGIAAWGVIVLIIQLWLAWGGG
jgi:hypothetical protein